MASDQVTRQVNDNGVDTMAKLTEARAKANKKWDDKNREKKRIYSYRSNARKYVRELADLDDLAELKEMIAEREEQLKN
jgi:hypothetical protein